MPAQTQLVDTNVLLRFFTGDPPDMAARARGLIARADCGEIALIIPVVVLAETFFTLESFYKLKRVDIACKLIAFLESRGIVASESEVVVAALTLIKTRKAHFVDAYLAARAASEGVPINSFDRNFDKFPGVLRNEPGGRRVKPTPE